jgi:hypothetical protein
MNMAGQGLVNPEVAGARILEAADIPDREELAPPPPDPAQAQFAQMMMQAEMADKMANIELTKAKVQQAMAAAAKDATDANLAQYQMLIDLLEAQSNAMATALGGRPQGMARAPGNGSAPQGPRPNGGNPAPIGVGGLLARQPLA